jgi:integrase
VTDMLMVHRRQQAAMQTASGEAWEDHDLVFTSRNGGYFNPRYLAKVFHTIPVEIGLPHLTFHSLRHSSATLLLSMGVEMKVIQHILGHSSFTMTADTYSHVLPTMQQEAREKWETMFHQETPHAEPEQES